MDPSAIAVHANIYTPKGEFEADGDDRLRSNFHIRMREMMPVSDTYFLAAKLTRSCALLLKLPRSQELELELFLLSPKAMIRIDHLSVLPIISNLATACESLFCSKMHKGCSWFRWVSTRMVAFLPQQWHVTRKIPASPCATLLDLLLNEHTWKVALCPRAELPLLPRIRSAFLIEYSNTQSAVSAEEAGQASRL